MVVKSLAKWRSPNKTKWNVRKSFKIKWHNRWLALSCFEQLIFSQNLTIPYGCDEYFHFLLVTNSYYYSHIYSVTLVKNLIQTVNAYTYGALGLSTGSMDRSLLHKRRYKRYERLRKVREIKHLLGPFSHNPPPSSNKRANSRLYAWPNRDEENKNLDRTSCLCGLHNTFKLLNFLEGYLNFIFAFSLRYLIANETESLKW